MTSHPTRSYTLKTSSARLTPCVPFTAIVRKLCVATVISRPRARARFLFSLCRRGCRSALLRRLCLRANTFRLFGTSSLILLPLSSFLPFILISRRGFSRHTRVASPIFRLRGESGAYSQAPLPSPAFRGGTVSQFCCHDDWYERSALWI